MRKVTLKANAKINLTLDVLGTKQGYHLIKSLVAPIELGDQITVKRRADSKINLVTKGIKMDCDITDNNAYKAARMFMEKYSTTGVDIKITKNIPLSSGLGGSSADIVGVLKAMKQIYEINGDLVSLANCLGSDTAYMLNGGYAVIEGRGEKVTPKHIETTLYLVILTCEQGISAKASYAEFDKQKEKYLPMTETVLKALQKNDQQIFLATLNNHLYNASRKLVPQIEINVSNLKRAGAETVVMAGSGSAVCGIFVDKKQRDKVFNRLYPLYQDMVIKTQTVPTVSK